MQTWRRFALFITSLYNWKKHWWCWLFERFRNRT